MRFTSEQRLDDGVIERDFTLGEIPGILWTPASPSAPVPLILSGHPGGLEKMHPRLAAGEPVDEIVDTLVLPLAEHAVPEWQAALDALLPLPEISGRVGYEGGVIAIGIRLAVAEPRISAALLFAGSFVPRTLFEQARQVTIPLQFLLQWDDEGNDRQLALDLFYAFGSKEKTPHANLGGHAGVPSFEIDAGARFFARHLS